MSLRKIGTQTSMGKVISRTHTRLALTKRQRNQIANFHARFREDKTFASNLVFKRSVALRNKRHKPTKIKLSFLGE